MRKVRMSLSVLSVIALAACNGSTVNAPRIQPSQQTLPGPSNAIPVPAGVSASSGYSVSVFAAPPSGSTKPDSIVQIGNSVFVGFGDTVKPDGTPGPTGQSQVEIVQYSLSGAYQKTFTVTGHNDGLMEFDPNTLWAMSNEDGNAKLIVINIASGTQQTYLPQAGLQDATGALPHGGGLDDMTLINGQVYVSASNPAASSTAACPANSSTPACPNGVNSGSFVYMLTLNAGASTFNLTPVVSSSSVATNSVTNAAATFNITDPDSEVVTPDGSTLIVDGQADSELALIRNPGSNQTVSFVPLTSAGAAQQVDDTRFVPSNQTFALVADTPANLIYRIDGNFTTGDAYSAGQTAFMKLTLASGVLNPIVSGLQAPHGIAFVH